MCHSLAGLRDLVDFLPASLAAIIDYFSSEVTRGVWKLVPMNGTDWLALFVPCFFPFVACCYTI